MGRIIRLTKWLSRPGTVGNKAIWVTDPEENVIICYAA